jgi:retron-type reverse transcriptase
MSLEDAKPQMARQLEFPWGSRGEAPRALRSEEASTAASGTERSGASDVMERVVSRPNLQAALKRVRKNKGSPGIDGMTVDELPDFLRENWARLREQLLTGSYQPQPVRRQLIPKGGGGMRELGIPTVLDRFIQQALLQVLQPRFDPTFSEHSHGFRPGRRAHDAVCEAQRYLQGGCRWVVDVDLEKFFDRVHHDVLMGKLAKRIEDKRMLGLVRRYLDAGIMLSGVVVERHEGTPQGGPLSPLLANVLLDEVDQELEKRGHAFVRYADDCNVYVRSKRAGERVMELLRRLAPKALGRMKARVRLITRRTRGRSLQQVCEDLKGYLQGWYPYFQLVETPGVLARLDEWIRHRLRALQLKQWKRGRTIFRELHRRGMSRGAAARVAGNGRRWWKNSALTIHIALPNSLFDKLGLPRLAA